LQQNHYLVLSSGRPLQSIKQVKEQLQLPDNQVFLIGFNGGVIYDCEQKKTIYEHRIEKSLVEPVFQLANESSVACTNL
jgi:hydroxymethylpyrimidine pyrophosphatase-like HAD family hydrolase